MILHERLEALLDHLELNDGMGISFHHHLRDGDQVINPVLKALRARDIKDIHLYASSIFPSYIEIKRSIQSGHIKHITTNYMNGPVADYISENGLPGKLTMQTHGGRARAIEQGENRVDIAFIAAPALGRDGSISGTEGKNAFGSIGYAMPDAQYAKVKVAITDTPVDAVKQPQIDGASIDHGLIVDSIGDLSKMAGGTLQISTDPLGLKIARDTLRVLKAVDAFKDGVSFQSGAGGISLSITHLFNETLKERGLKASFYSGGITAQHVYALEHGLVQDLYDVQCFDKAAARSLRTNAHHHAMSANRYADPTHEKRIIKDLDIVILGASEIDLDFNVNVTTDSYNRLIGGSGGHSDTAEDSKLTIIVSPLIKARTVLIKDRVNTITTPGRFVDVLITERGIAINPRRKDLVEALEKTRLPVMPIETLQKKAYNLTGEPAKKSYKETPIGIVESRHGKPIDTLYKKG
ncbi:MAG: citrate lyase subunit alpha [Bacillota bacterium]